MIKQLFSPEAIRRTFVDVWLRFPVSVCWVMFLAVWGLAVIWGVLEFRPEILWCMAEGFLLSLAVGIWTEFLDKTRFALPLQLAGIALVVADGLVLTLSGGIHSESAVVGHTAIVCALAVAIIFIPVSRFCDARRLWAYTMIQCGEIAAAVCLGIVMCIAGLVIYSTVGLLFSYSMDHALESWLLLGGVCIPLVFLLGRIVRVDQVRTDIGSAFSLAGGFCRNVMLPLTLLYTLILYIYAAKILLTWQLPDGQVSWMVTGLMCAVLVLLYGLQTVRFDSSSRASAARIVSLAIRWLPILMLPLLFLMSVGIIYRINQYGITAQRLYVSAFNIWAYAVAAYLIVMKKEAVYNKIAMSFAVVFVAVSVIPGMNFISITNRVMRAEVLHALGGCNLPMSVEDAREALAELPEAEARHIASRLEYLDSWENHSMVEDIVRSDDRIWESALVDSYDYIRTETFYLDVDSAVEIPAGFTSVRYGRVDADAFAVDADSVYDNINSLTPEPMSFRSAEGDSLAVVVNAAVERSKTTSGMTVRSVRGYIFKK